jgi:hypothetical protein
MNHFDGWHSLKAIKVNYASSVRIKSRKFWILTAIKYSYTEKCRNSDRFKVEVTKNK